jgi:hypothetical protein
MLQSTVVQRVCEPTSATCLWSGSFFGMARRLLSCEILTEGVHPCAQAACSAISIGQTAASLHNSNGILSPPILKLSALRSDTPTRGERGAHAALFSEFTAFRGGWLSGVLKAGDKHIATNRFFLVLSSPRAGTRSQYPLFIHHRGPPRPCSAAYAVRFILIQAEGRSGIVRHQRLEFDCDTFPRCGRLHPSRGPLMSRASHRIDVAKPQITAHLRRQHAG